MADYFEEACKRYLNSAFEASKTHFDRAMWSSWSIGTFALIGGLRTIKEFPPISNDRAIAISVLNLLMQPMITMWLCNWESQESPSSEESLEARKIAFQNAQTFMGINSPESMEYILF
ncbi:hypothetical protein ACFLXH_05850 [Chloroflexota bacterium]